MRNIKGSGARWAFLVIASLLACTDDPPVTEPTQQPLPAPAVSLSIIPSSADLRLGDQLEFIHKAVDASGRVVTSAAEWASDNPAVATIGRTDGRATAVGAGAALITVTANGLKATATVSVHIPAPSTIRIAVTEVVLAMGASERLSAQVFDQNGRLINTPVTWASDNPQVASISGDGTVTGTGTGNTVVTASAGMARTQVAVRVEAATFLVQWAASATASTQYSNDMWSAAQAVGPPNVTNCNDDSKAWASLDANGQDWLELKYNQPVRPTEIRIYEAWAPGSIIKVDVKGESGNYHEVYSSAPVQLLGTCLRTLIIPVTNVTELVSAVRVRVDQRHNNDWNEIDAVRLTGHRQP